MPLTPLSDFKGPPYRPKIPVIAGLALVALLDATSVPLKWVGVITPSGGYVIASGIQQASWMLVVAVVVAGLAIRLAIAAPATWVRCLFVALDFFVPLGMYLEYIDNLGRAESYTTTPYLGPGYYLALGATALLIGSTVLGWRERDEWIPKIQRRVD
jgi:hypothetical protein